MGDGTRLETGRATSLEGSTPSSAAASFRRASRAPGRAVRHQSSKLDRRVQLPRGTLGNRLTGRLPDFESGGGGSNPPSRTWTELVLSEPGTIRCRDNSVSGTIRDNSVSVHHYCFPCIKSVSWIHGKTSKTDRR